MISMENKYLIVVDMQKDFVEGALGSKEAAEIVPAVVEKIRQFQGTVIYTMDTHTEEYLSTQEGRYLPVKHCIKGTEGWRLVAPVEELRAGQKAAVYEKSTFACRQLAEDLLAKHQERPIDSIELSGVCTDICVVSNALLLKAYLPETQILADASCMAGVTPGKHQAALETMRSCQIIVK